MKRCPNALCFERRATIWIKAETERTIEEKSRGGRSTGAHAQEEVPPPPPFLLAQQWTGVYWGWSQPDIWCHHHAQHQHLLPSALLMSLLASLLSKSELIKMSTRNKSKLKDETEKDEFVLNLDNVRWSWPSLPATEPVARASASLSPYIRTTEIMLVVGQILTWEPASSSI